MGRDPREACSFSAITVNLHKAPVMLLEWPLSISSPCHWKKCGKKPEKNIPPMRVVSFTFHVICKWISKGALQTHGISISVIIHLV